MNTIKTYMKDVSTWAGLAAIVTGVGNIYTGADPDNGKWQILLGLVAVVLKGPQAAALLAAVKAALGSKPSGPADRP